MKTIILATDYSKPATAAMEYAVKLAQFMNAKLVLFNAFSLAIPTSLPNAALIDVEERIAMNKKNLKGIAADLKHKYNLTVEVITTTLTFLDGLNKVMKYLQADLVMMGIKKHSFERKMLGSSTTSVINQARYPVLVIPENIMYTPITNILFACDHSSISLHNRIQFLAEFANAYKARVHVLKVEKKKSRQQSLAGNPEVLKIPAIEKLLSSVQHDYHTITQADVAEGLKRAIKEHKATILVMVPRTANYWDTVFSRSKTREMVFASPVPLLVLPNTKLTPVREKNADRTKIEIVF